MSGGQLLMLCVFAYLIGAIPVSWLFVRVLKGIDLRTVGSGNLGSTNAMRVLGVPLGVTVQALDILKGWLPAAAPGLLFGQGQAASPVAAAPIVSLSMAGLAAGICAVLGHMFPIYLKFRGGKGVNTSIGVYLALAPTALLVAAATGLLLLAALRYVSVASMTGAVALSVAVCCFYSDNPPLIVVTALLAILVIVMHRLNIKRLLAGTESKLGKRIAAGESNDQESRRSET